MSRPPKNKVVTLMMKVSIVLVLIGVVVLGMNYDRIKRLRAVITLFDAEIIVENFRSMDSIFESHPVHRGDSVFAFESSPGELPETFEYEGETLNVAEFIDETDTTGLVVIHNDAIVFEEYYRGNTDATQCISWSVGKSFVSALMGIAVEDGLIEDIQDPVTKYVPVLKGSGYDGVSIKDVLQMSSGVRWNEDYADVNSDISRMGRAIALNTSLDEFTATLEREREPGTLNHYVSMDTQVLGMVLRSVTGQTLSSYLEDKIWTKIGMESDAYWLVDGNGMELAFGGLNVVLRDYARFGRLYLNNGNWNGEQIISEDWVQASITPDAPYLMPGVKAGSDWNMGYGYQWWLPDNPEGDYMAIGIYNEFIYIHPELNVVIAKTSAYADYTIDGDAKEMQSVEFFRAIAHQAAGE